MTLKGLKCMKYRRVNLMLNSHLTKLIYRMSLSNTELKK